MVNIILVQFVILLLSLSSFAKVDRVHLESYLGEKNLEGYEGRYMPLINQNIYHGKMIFSDQQFFQNYFVNYISKDQEDSAEFIQSELKAAMVCTNEQLGEHFDEIRFAYRLIALSYLLEGQWNLKLTSDHLRLQGGCEFNLKSWIKSCSPKTVEMKKFLGHLLNYLPRYDESFPATYSRKDWWNEFSQEGALSYSHIRLRNDCHNKCSIDNISSHFKKTCLADQQVMSQICSETDQIYGLSEAPDAFYLIALSNIINTFNKKGEAIGCLRRFRDIMAHKEFSYDVLKNIFVPIQYFLRQKYQERFLQGRVFFFGSGKEYEQKGLSDLYVKEQFLKIIEEPKISRKIEIKSPEKKTPLKITLPKSDPKPSVVKAEAPKVDVAEIKHPIKTAFLQASEHRALANLASSEVDMLQFKYDFVFTLNMINVLSTRLKTFLTRETLIEMKTYDKLGTKDAPIPLLFLKYLIDVQEHQALWNIVSVVGDRFYVSNEIDASFSPKPELTQLLNNESTGNQWRLIILKPEN